MAKERHNLSRKHAIFEDTGLIVDRGRSLFHWKPTPLMMDEINHQINAMPEEQRNKARRQAADAFRSLYLRRLRSVNLSIAAFGLGAFRRKNLRNNAPGLLEAANGYAIAAGETNETRFSRTMFLDLPMKSLIGRPPMEWPILGTSAPRWRRGAPRPIKKDKDITHTFNDTGLTVSMDKEAHRGRFRNVRPFRRHETLEAVVKKIDYQIEAMSDEKQKDIARGEAAITLSKIAEHKRFSKTMKIRLIPLLNTAGVTLPLAITLGITNPVTIGVGLGTSIVLISTSMMWAAKVEDKRIALHSAAQRYKESITDPQILAQLANMGHLSFPDVILPFDKPSLMVSQMNTRKQIT